MFTKLIEQSSTEQAKLTLWNKFLSNFKDLTIKIIELLVAGRFQKTEGKLLENSHRWLAWQTSVLGKKKKNKR